MKKITRLTYNWCQTSDGREAGEDYEVAKIGVNDVIKITEHAAAGEGYSWYYDIEYKNGTELRVFNPNSVLFE